MPIPNSHPKAMRSTFAKFWADAEQYERKGLLEKGCYEIVDLPAGGENNQIQMGLRSQREFKRTRCKI